MGQNLVVTSGESPTDEAPGWDLIDDAVAPIVGSSAPFHWGTGTSLPDQGGLWGVSAYNCGSHWFFVTYGLSELFTKVTDDPEVSGWGEELTMRVLRQEDDPPQWAVKLLARLGELVFQRKTPFLPGGRLEMPDGGGEVPPALAWTEDPELSPAHGPFGSVQFVATIGVSIDTLARMRSETTGAVVETVKTENPLLLVGGPGLTW
ncbi:MAG: suppressor of fused domain protein [Acidimicrobiales bacterium]|jgi:hypothetical protein